MNGPQFEALLTAATDGVSFDGLAVESANGGYHFETPDRRRENLSPAELQNVAGAESAFVTNWYYWTHVVRDGGGDDDRVGDGGDSSGGGGCGGRGGVAARARYAYLRWLERADEWDVPERYGRLADGVTRQWGQLVVTARVDDDGNRTYELRHRDDRGIDRESLDAHTDPLDARELAKFDDDGRYRPLKTAPTLRRGWTVVDLDGDDLVRAVDFFYPATVANWYLEREGNLDVTHWREAAARQTGIYDVVDELPKEALEWAVEACCVDSQCLKRREWDRDEQREVDVPRGDGEFPCREPCSLFVAAAREWALLERETSRTYEFELAPSEREQLEALVDAVADGRAGDVREAAFDDGANRYRARYLRAKRFADEGFRGLDTDEE